MRFGGANQKELWLGFARRGFGKNATSTNTTANTDTDPMPDFESPSGRQRHDHLRRRNEDGSADPGADLRRSLPGPCLADRGHGSGHAAGQNLDDTARFAPGTLRVRRPTRPGYGHVRFRADVPHGQEPRRRRSGSRRTARRRPGRDGDRRHSGCDAGRAGASSRNLIDDTEATNWTAAGDVSSGQPVRRRQAGDGRPGRDAAQQSSSREGQRDARSRSEPLHGAARVRDLGVQRRERRGLRGRIRVHARCTRARPTPSRATRRGRSRRC